MATFERGDDEAAADAADDEVADEEDAKERPPLDEDALSAFGRACLDSGTRARLYKLVRRLPGLNQNQIAKELDLHASTVHDHLDLMARYNVIAIREGARSNEKLCFASEDVDLWEDERTRILFGRDPLKHVGICLAENPGATVEEIASKMGLHPAGVYPHVETLEDHGLLLVEPIGGSHRHCAAPALKAWVDQVGDGYARRGPIE